MKKMEALYQRKTKKSFTKKLNKNNVEYIIRKINSYVSIYPFQFSI